MKKKVFKSTLALTLAAGMLFGSVNLPGLSKNLINIGAQEVQAAEPTDLEKLLKNLEALKANASAVMKGDPSFIDLINGSIDSMKDLASIYNSGTLFLKMAGIMKDPTSEKLMDIQYTLTDMNTTIKDMNMKMDDILSKLGKMEVFLEESERNREVENCLNIFTKFRTDYLENLQLYMKQYERLMNDGIRDWYKDSMNSRTPISIFYAINAAGQKIQVYNYSDEADPDSSVEGYKILKDETVRFSKEFVDRAMQSAGSYNVNTARDTIIRCMEAEIAREIDEGTLDAGEAFFENWATLNLSEKVKKIVTLAEEAYNSVSSGISKEQMDKSNLSTLAAAKFNAYCDNITNINSALDAEVNSLKYTHAFEGEVKEAIENVINSIGMTTGVYATMTLSMMHQCSSETDGNIQEVLDHWTQATDKIAKVKDTALTHHDNFCFLTNSLVTYEDRTMEYGNSITTRFDNSTTAYKSNSCTTGDILKEGDTIADPTKITMLWHIGKGQDKNLANYLLEQGIDFPADGAHDLLAERTPWRDFSPSNGISMNFGYRGNSAGTDYWGETFTCTVNQGNKSGVENKYFNNCKYMTGSVFNLKDDNLKSNEVLGAMASYAENHWYWFRDEVYIMGNADTCDHKVNITDESQTYDKEGSHLRMTIQDVCNYKKTYGVLVLKPLPKEEEISATTQPADNFIQIFGDITDITPAVTEEHCYEIVNPDQDKSQLINGDTEGQEEMIPAEEESLKPEEETATDPTADPSADPVANPATDPMTPADTSVNVVTDSAIQIILNAE